MPLTGTAYFSHEQKDDKGEVIAEAMKCAHCNAPLVASEFLITVQDRRNAMDPPLVIHFAHLSCERKAFGQAA